MSFVEVILAVYGYRTESGDVLTKEAALDILRQFNEISSVTHAELIPDNESETKGKIVIKPGAILKKREEP